MKKEGKTWSDYEKLNKKDKSTYNEKGLYMAMACIFILGCYTKEPYEMKKKLAERYAHGDKDAYPIT